MNTKETIAIAGMEIDIVRKDIKNMHLAVYPPKGRVRLAAPTNADPEVLRLFAISKLAWIRKHVRNFEEHERESPRQYITGESHYFQGKRYRLELIERAGVKKVEQTRNRRIQMYVPPNTATEKRAELLKEWYRKQLKAQIPELLDKYSKVVGVQDVSWGVKQMRTKWGTCNIEARRIWINLELAKKPVICLEYIIVHELVHLHERHHNERFVALMDQFMPSWRLYRKQLNELPLAHEHWSY